MKEYRTGEQDVDTLNITLYVKMLLQIIRSIDTDRLDRNLKEIFDLSEIFFSEEKKLEKLREEGFTQGMQQGLLEGEQKLLIKQLEWRFGALGSTEKDRILVCLDGDCIEAASRAFAEGKSKDEVLAELI